MTTARRRLLLPTAVLALLCTTAAVAEPATAVRYPYVSALSRATDGTRVYFCAGTLVAPRWILTAAHCFHTRGGERIGDGGLWAVVGRDRLGAAGEGAHVRVDRVVLHPGYEPGAQDHDLALVRLDEVAGPLVADAAGPASDPERAVALGFGSFYEGRLAASALTSTGAPSAQVSDRLQRAQLRFLHQADCAPAGSPEAGLSLCLTAGPDEACVGDSGGPLVAEAAQGPDRLLGVLTGGTGCAVDAPRLAYLRVAPYAGWIAETIGKD